MKRGLKLELIFYINYNWPFFSLYKNIEVVIERFKTRYLIFMIEAGEHDLVLGQPFLNSVKFHQEYKLNGIFNTITHPHIY